MSREVYKDQTKDISLPQYVSKGIRCVGWGDKISAARKGKHFELAGWNKGLTKESSKSVAKIANNKERNEKIRQAMLGRKILWATKVSETKRKQLQDPEYVRRLFTACGTRPNKPEKKLTALLNKYFPNEWKYVGAGEVILGGKCPDYINVNGKKKLIELNGEYWHRNDNPEERIKWFKQYGFDTLVLWTKELKQENETVQKIKDFLRV